MTATELFDVLVELETDNCVVWPLHTHHGGHGYFEKNGVTYGVHREALRRHAGEPPDDAPFAIHGPCHEPRCMNYRHLSWGTHSQNMLDRARDGTTPDQHGENAPWAKLTELDVAHIRDAIAEGESQRSIADRYGICQSMVSKINRGIRWAPSRSDLEQAVIDAADKVRGFGRWAPFHPVLVDLFVAVDALRAATPKDGG